MNRKFNSQTNGGSLVFTTHGQFLISPRDTVIGPKLIETGQWEPEQTALLEKLLSPGDWFIDGGANIGWHTVVAAKRVGGQGLVMAFEPDAENFALLKENIRRNRISDQVHMFQKALTDSSGPVALEISPDNLGDHRVRYPNTIQPKDQNLEHFAESHRKVIQVPGETMDNVVAEVLHQTRKTVSTTPNLIPSEIQLIKLDTQGGEERILAGSSTTLAKTRFLLTEFWPYGLIRAGGSVEGYLQHVMRHFDRVRVISGLASHLATLQTHPPALNDLPAIGATLHGGAFLDLLFYRNNDAETF